MRNLYILFLIFIFRVPNNSLAGIQNTTSRSLHQNWSFYYMNHSYTATVPGCIHTDLLHHNLIPDPFFGNNDSVLQWIGQQAWTYSLTFDLEPEELQQEQVELIFNGLDTYATVYLNDSLVLHASNMFRTWGVACKKQLKVKNNLLKIVFESAEKKSMALYLACPYKLPGEERVMTRKAQFQYGWDFGPRFLTCGIWKSIVLQSWSRFHISSETIHLDSMANQTAYMTLNMRISSTRKQTIFSQIAGNDSNYGTPVKEMKIRKGWNQVKMHFQVKHPRLWWCNGYGKPDLYTLGLVVSDRTGYMESAEVTYGIRTIELVQAPDSAGTGFFFHLNGVPVFMKGANYVPMDIFASGLTPSRYDSLIADAADCNFNMLRVWGGGWYEDDAFYKACDKKGIMVWQDFMFAGGMYPADTGFYMNVKQEAHEQVERLSKHPCLAMFCGNNEISEGWHRWGWQDGFSEDAKRKMDGDYNLLFKNLLPLMVKNYSNLPYWESSPSLGRGDPWHTSRGDAHNWFVWHDGEPFSNYKQKVPRFMSEFGFQSYPSMNTIRSISKAGEPLSSNSILAHQKNKRGHSIIQKYMDSEFPQARNDADFIYLSQVLQTEGIVTGIEAHRNAKPWCMGSLYWQFNDCWPAISWSSREYSGKWKALQYAVRRAFETFAITVQSEGDSMCFRIVSDSLRPCEGNIKISTWHVNGKKEMEKSIPVSVAANMGSSFKLAKGDLQVLSDDSLSKMIDVVFFIEGRAVTEKIYYFGPSKNIRLEDPRIQLRVEVHPNESEIILETEKPARYVYLDNGMPVNFSDNYFDMLPGRTYRVSLKNYSDESQAPITIRSLFDIR